MAKPSTEPYHWQPLQGCTVPAAAAVRKRLPAIAGGRAAAAHEVAGRDSSAGSRDRPRRAWPAREWDWSAGGAASVSVVRRGAAAGAGRRRRSHGHRLRRIGRGQRVGVVGRPSLAGSARFGRPSARPRRCRKRRPVAPAASGACRGRRTIRTGPRPTRRCKPPEAQRRKRETVSYETPFQIHVPIPYRS